MLNKLCALIPLLLIAADYPQFRGPNGNGVAPDSALPVTFDKSQIAWQAKLPGSGWAQPIILGSTVYVSAAVSDKLDKPKDMMSGVKDNRSMPGLGSFAKAPNVDIKWTLYALDLETGAIKWSKPVSEGKPKYPIHPSNTYATESPCADANGVYAFFGASGTLAAFDHAGKQMWKREFGAFPFSNGFGSGGSPILNDGKIYISSFNESKSFIVAVDTKTGEEVWRVSPPKPGSAWASPMLWKNSIRSEIIACGDKLVLSLDPKTGAELWRLGGLDTAFAPSPTADGDRLHFGASSPFSSSPLYGVKAGAKGDISLKKGETSNAFVLWSRNKANVGMASPVASEGLLYFATDGKLTCYDGLTGKEVYSERLPKSRMVASSPMLVGDKLLILEETGKVHVVKTGKTFELLGTSEIKDTFWATPAISGERLFLRGIDGVYCIKK
jgi:outer membrane protein assembly factor BamB